MRTSPPKKTPKKHPNINWSAFESIEDIPTRDYVDALLHREEIEAEELSARNARESSLRPGSNVRLHSVA